MNKIVKRILIVIGIIALLFTLISVGFIMKFKSETKGMHIIETKKIIDNIYSINDSFVNLFLIQDGNQYIAVDAGNNIEKVTGELKKLNINPDKIIAVMLTHTDRDHVAALKLFKNAKVYFSAQEVQMINGKKSKFLFFGNKIDSKEYTLLQDQQMLTIGNIKIKGILTPGHTSGSMCYLVNDKYLFVGDALSIKDGKIGKFNEFFNMDHKMAIKSIVNITKLPEAEYIFSAHYGYTNDYKNAVKDWK